MMAFILVILSFSINWTTFYNSEMLNGWARHGDTLYLATNGGILQAILRDSLIITKRFTNVDGLREPVINSITVDEYGNVWAIGDHHVFFKNGDAFVPYDGLNFDNDSLTSIATAGDCIFISSITGIRIISMMGTPSNFGDDRIATYNSYNLPIESDSILKLRIMRDTLLFGTPREFCYSPLPGFPDSLVRIPSDSLPGAYGSRKTIRDFYKGPRVLAILTNNAVFLRDFQNNWHVIQSVNNGRTHWFCGYHTISGINNDVYVGLGCLRDNANLPVRTLPLVKIDSTGNAAVLSPDSLVCDYPPHVTQVIPISPDTLIIGTVCNHSYNLSFSERKCGGVTYTFHSGTWTAQNLGLLEINYISGIKKTSDGRIWLFSSLIYLPTYYSRLFYFDGKRFYPSGNFNHVFHDSTGELDLLTDIEVDNTGRLWVATNHNGIFRIDGDSFDIHLYPSEFVKTIGFTGNNELVFTTNSGTFLHSETQDTRISSLTNVYSITHDQQGNLWLADISNGFEVYSPSHQLVLSSANFFSLTTQSFRCAAHMGSYHFLGSDNGIVVINGEKLETTILPGVVIRSLALDSHGYLWALTEEGVYVIDTRDFSIKYYFSTFNSGLVGNTRDVGPNFFYYKLIRDDILVDENSHTVWIGSTHGVSVIKTDLYWNYAKEAASPIIFPSPVRSDDRFVTISGLNDKERVSLYKMDGTKVKVELERGKGFVRFETRNLSAGTYIVLVGDKKLLFSVIK